MKIIVKGNIGADATLRKTQDGISVLDFSIAENFKKRDGSTKTVWTKVTIWEKYAEAMAPHLKKGRKVLVMGEAEEPETYLNSGNVVKARVHINRNVDIDLLDRPEAADDTAPWAATEAAEV